MKTKKENLDKISEEINMTDIINSAIKLEKKMAEEQDKTLKKGILKIKPDMNYFPFIKVTGNQEQFSEIKHFCLDCVTISYEYATGIEDYWLITVDDMFRGKISVPVGDYIVSIPDVGFVVISQYDIDDFFNQEEYTGEK